MLLNIQFHIVSSELTRPIHVCSWVLISKVGMTRSVVSRDRVIVLTVYCKFMRYIDYHECWIVRLLLSWIGFSRCAGLVILSSGTESIASHANCKQRNSKRYFILTCQIISFILWCYLSIVTWYTYKVSCNYIHVATCKECILYVWTMSLRDKKGRLNNCALCKCLYECIDTTLNNQSCG